MTTLASTIAIMSAIFAGFLFATLPGTVAILLMTFLGKTLTKENKYITRFSHTTYGLIGIFFVVILLAIWSAAWPKTIYPTVAGFITASMLFARLMKDYLKLIKSIEAYEIARLKDKEFE